MGKLKKVGIGFGAVILAFVALGVIGSMIGDYPSDVYEQEKMAKPQETEFDQPVDKQQIKIINYKPEYGLEDVIKVEGRIEAFEPLKKADGTMTYPHQSVSVLVDFADTHAWESNSEVRCMIDESLSKQTLADLRTPEGEKCPIEFDEHGNFSHEFEVTDDHFQGSNHIVILNYISGRQIDTISEPFMIR